MRLILVLAAGVAVLAACSPQTSDKSEKSSSVVRKREPLRVISKLECPERQGALRRVAIAPDGLSCTYDADQAEVMLRLVRFEGESAEAALAPIETELRGLMPHLRPAAPTVRGKNAAHINLPGVSIDARDEGANIRIGGMSITADDGTAQVRVSKNLTQKDSGRTTTIEERKDGGRESRTVRISADDEGDGTVDIRADDEGAVVRHRQKESDGVRATLVLASDKAPSGYHLTGYEARGPQGGPLAVATVKAKRRDTDDGALFKAMKALVRHNVGG